MFEVEKQDWRNESCKAGIGESKVERCATTVKIPFRFSECGQAIKYY